MGTNNSTNNFGISQYIVSATPGNGSYRTIQSAMNAANAAGGGTVYIQPGSYVENLTFFDKVDLWGAVGVADTGTCIITGIHTPPSTGAITIRNINLASATDVFNSSASGSATLILIDCFVAVTNGYTFNLPNWTGTLVAFDVGQGGTNNGEINNVGGATVFYTNVTAGKGSGNTCVISGAFEIFDVAFNCPIMFQGTASGTINGGSWVLNTLTTSDTANVQINNSLLSTGPNVAITHNSSSPLVLGDVSINSSATNVIDGSGNVKIGSVTFENSSGITGITIDQTSAFQVGTAFLNNISFDRGATRITGDGQLIIGDSTGVPKIATLTAGSNVSIVNGNGSITINASSGGLTWNAATTDTTMVAGNAYIAANNVSLVTLTLPDPQQLGDMLQVVGFGDGGWRIAQNAGQIIHLGSSATTTGVAGFLEFVDQYDCITLVSVNSNQWVAYGAIGNINVN